MSLLVTCSCGQSFRAKPELAGKQVPCPMCGTTLRIPAPRPSGPKRPSITVTCQCGRSFGAKPELAGQRVACPACGGPLQIPRAAQAPAVADDPFDLGGIDLANLGPPAPGSAASSLLSTPAKAPARRRSKQDLRAIRKVLIVGGAIAGGLVGLLVLALVVPFVIQQFMGGYRTPEAAFAAATQAAEREDWRGFCGCLTPRSRDALACTMIHAVSHIANARSFAAASGIGAGQPGDAKIQPVLDVLQQHGLDDETIKRMASELPFLPTASDTAKIDQALAPIRDRNGFVGDMMTALRQLENRPGATPFATQAELTDIKIDGDRATAMVVSTDSGSGRRQSISFQRSGGGWRIDAFDR
jgi:hypothetical protein